MSNLHEDKRLMTQTCFRYGQDEIADMLTALGAQETVEAPKKVSIVGDVDPPWVRRVSRREQAA